MPGQLKFGNVYPPQGGGARLHVKVTGVGGGLHWNRPVGISSNPHGLQHSTIHRSAKPLAGVPLAVRGVPGHGHGVHVANRLRKG